ncbi:putative UDP-glucose 4-epimerase [hydrothermal vent metagenome]|uniref:Putative UDP-glucose 4-epimerase n=1 Tax=hydrothermal vent metagenome TaxID=652676 RepID=A0A3B0RKZ5_9ZZZZ
MRNQRHSARTAKVLVFGAGGRLGTLLQKAWARNPPQGIAPFYHARNRPRSGPSDFQWENPTSPLPAADVIIALWGVTSGSDKDLTLNTSLAHASLEAARKSRARLVLHFSSSAVYGPAQNATESSPTNPANAYGHAKLAMEHAISNFPDEGITHCCLRLANVVGADSLAPALRAKTPVKLDRFKDGRGPLRSYVAMGHLAQVLEKLCAIPRQTLPTILNVASPEPVEMQALAEAAGKPIRWQPAPDTAIQRVTMEASQLARLLPKIDPLTTARDMITDWQQLETMA